MVDPRTERLVHVAYWARRWFAQKDQGLNGSHDDILIGRSLTEALEAFVEDVPPLNDADQAYYRERLSADIFARR